MNPTTTSVSEIFPLKRTLPLSRLYLGQNLLRISENLKRSFVYTNYLTNEDDIIAVKDEDGNFQVAKEIKNVFDWLLFQQLEAQADVIITSSAYLRRFSTKGEEAEDVLSVFEPGNTFENLGNWRLQHGYKTRSPDIAIVARSLNFRIPDIQKLGNRKIIVFTPDMVADSPEAQVLQEAGIAVIGSGAEGVDGKIMIGYLSEKMLCRTIEMTTGPAVLKILLDANVLDRIYISRVRRKIPVIDSLSVKRILSDGGKLSDRKDFILTQRYIMEKCFLEDGTITSQQFLCYDNKRFLSEL